MYCFLRPYTANEGGNQRVYVWLQEFFVDPEQNWNDDTRNAHHFPELELFNLREKAGTAEAGGPRPPRREEAGGRAPARTLRARPGLGLRSSYKAQPRPLAGTHSPAKIGRAHV